MTSPYDDIDVLARTLYGEARSEGIAGMLAVAWVVRNRVEADLGHDNKPDWWGEGWIGVCKKPRQFSCWNPEDANFTLIQEANFNQRAFRVAYGAAIAVYERLVPDLTYGATHYFTIAKPAYAAIWPPVWSAAMKNVAVLGDHTFYRDVNALA